MRLCLHLILLITIFILIENSLFALKTSSIYFKISIDGQTYYEDILTGLNAVNNKLQYLAFKLIEKYMNIADINSDYYQINIYYDVKFLDKKLDIYNFVPIFNDRFRHVIGVKNNLIISEEVYDHLNMLLYSYALLNFDIDKEANVKKIYRRNYIDTVPLPCYKGFNAVYKKSENDILHVLYSDGLNRFSIFKKKIRKSMPEENKIIFGNYVYRVAKNGYIYAIIGTIPFKEMKRFLYLYIKKEEEKQ